MWQSSFLHSPDEKNLLIPIFCHFGFTAWIRIRIGNPDPEGPLNPDPIRIQSGSGYTTLALILWEPGTEVSHLTGTDILIFLGLVELLLFLKTRIRNQIRFWIQKIEGSDPDPEKVIRIRNTDKAIWRQWRGAKFLNFPLKLCCRFHKKGSKTCNIWG